MKERITTVDNSLIKKHVEAVMKSISQLGFSLHQFELKKERYASFIFNGKEMRYHYSLNYLHNDNIAEKIGISNDEITSIVRDCGMWKPSKSQKEWMLGFENIALFLNPENSDGYFNSNYYENMKLYADPLEYAKLVRRFEKVVLNKIREIINLTNSLLKLDDYINTRAFAKGETPLLLFSGNLQKQVLVGMLVAFLVKRPGYSELVNVYYNYVSKLPIDDYPIAGQFLQVYKCLKRQN